MNELCVINKKSKRAHIIYGENIGMYDSFCGKELNPEKYSICAQFDCYREDFCKACVGRYKMKYGTTPSWKE